MGVVIVAGDIPRWVFRTLTQVIHQHEHEPVSVIKFGLEHRFEGGESPKKLRATLHRRLGITPVPADDEDFDGTEELLGQELLKLQQELWDKAWGEIATDNPIRAVITGQEFQGNDNWNWLDDSRRLPASTPFYVYHIYTRTGSGKLQIQDGCDERYGQQLRVFAPKR